MKFSFFTAEKSLCILIVWAKFHNGLLYFSVQIGIDYFEPHREKTGFLPRRKQRRRSASR